MFMLRCSFAFKIASDLADSGLQFLVCLLADAFHFVRLIGQVILVKRAPGADPIRRITEDEEPSIEAAPHL
jgi:hypothetical protein